jgi:hypothetical protein
MNPTYEIGQEIYWASFSSYAEDYVTCPDCGGSARLRVTFHDETMVSIPCANCARGYEQPTGRIIVHCRKGKVTRGTISGMVIREGEVEYHGQCYCTADDGRLYTTTNHIKENDVFLAEADAQARADQMASEYDAEERAKIFKKEKDQRSWAWNASYHRKQIKDAQRNLEYHTKKLAVAAIKAKENKENAA